jgi:hypothetical protein
MDTEFLERRELQLLVEAATHPPDSHDQRHLLRLSNRLCEAIVKIEAEAIDPLLPGLYRLRNPWHDYTDAPEPNGWSFFSK